MPSLPSRAKTLRALALAAVLVPAAALAMSGGKTPSAPVAARVDGTVLTRSDILAQREFMPPQMRGASDEAIYPVILDQAIDTRVLAAAARKDKLKNDPDVKRRLAQIEEQVLRDAYIKRHLAKVLTEAEQKRRYDELLKSFPEGEEVRARHILVKTKAEAEAIIKALAKKDATFETLARAKSKDGSAADGGDLGYFTKDGMVPEFVEVAFALKAGETTAAPVETKFGWHVIKLEDRRRTAPPAFEEIKAQFYVQLSREEVLKLIDDVRGKAKIERFAFDGTPAKAP